MTECAWLPCTPNCNVTPEPGTPPREYRCGNDQASFPDSAKPLAVGSGLLTSRLIATKYLNALSGGGFVLKQKIGRSNYYINVALNAILTGESMPGDGK